MQQSFPYFARLAVVLTQIATHFIVAGKLLKRTTKDHKSPSLFTHMVTNRVHFPSPYNRAKGNYYYYIALSNYSPGA